MLAEPSAILQVEALKVAYGASRVLQGVDLAVQGRPLALVGRNGMGKSTLCNAIMGLIPSQGGRVLFGGQDLTGSAPERVARAGIGYVPQGRRIFPSLTVAEHLRLVARRGGAWSVERVYDTFPRLAERRRNGGAQLSGGEQQMLAIARALLTNPAFLVLDEPTEGLSPLVVTRVVEVLHQLTADGMGIFLVEQNLAVAGAVAEEIAVMVSGRIALRTESAALLANEALQRRYLGVATHG